MQRIARLTPRFYARRRSLGVAGDSAIAVARTIGALTREPLPSPQDLEGMMPPVARYWFRRVPSFNLWVWFAFDDASVTVVSLTATPPVPILSDE